MNKKLYGFPMLRKAGLGNMLIPYAECMLWCKDYDVKMISPFWFRLRLGPIIRKERDKRLYNRLFNSPGQIKGVQRLVLLTFSKRVSVEQWWTDAGKEKTNSKFIIVFFSDMNHFDRLVGRNTEVSAGIKHIIRKEYLPTGLNNRPFIGIHVRLGDFPRMNEESINKTVYFRLPVQWYVDCLREIRKALGKAIEAIIFSDGTDTELAPLLREPSVSRSPFKTAITDMLAISQSSVMITSRSTFSLWGAYLGQVPSIWYPPKSDVCGNGVINKDGAPDHEIEWRLGEHLPVSFIRIVLERIRKLSSMEPTMIRGFDD